ncbi:MAG: TRAP transporter large permease subunit [Candidatus Atribacteria bacterium]|nr:TRAP transporter large permease subunit [Candidatus Atribacteria bacterium]
MDSILIALIVITIFIVLLLMGVPVFAALGLSGTIGILLIRGPSGLQAIPSIMYDKIRSFILVAVPLFILMGQVIFYSGIGEDLYTLGSRWLSRLPGGLAMASVLACTIFAAMSGVSIAGAATIGSFAIPEMLKRGYDKSLATGTVAAAGALALLIPPSVGFIVYGELVDESVGMLFIGGIIPGIVLSLMMMAYIGIYACLKPRVAPKSTEKITWTLRMDSLLRTWPALVLIIAVLGSIYLGLATPTQSAAIGFVVSLILARFVYKKMDWTIFRNVVRSSMLTSGMILLIFICAMFFGYVLTFLRVPQYIMEFIANSGWPNWLSLTAIMALLFVLGMFVDVVSVITISAPLLVPTVTMLGYNTLWFGIIMGITLEMAVITPPVGLNLYTIKSVSPPDISLTDILRGVIPFIIIEIIVLIIFISFPNFCLWLPYTMK